MFFKQLLTLLLIGTEHLNICVNPTSGQIHQNTMGTKLCNGECCINSFEVRGICVECPRGKFGENCAKNCPSNTYGQLCTETCNCTDGLFCSSIHGCVPPPVYGCPEGKTGPGCKENCMPGYFGKNCTYRCLCNPEQYCNLEKGCRDIIDNNRLLSVLSSKFTHISKFTKHTTDSMDTGRSTWISRNATAVVTVLAIVAIGAILVLLFILFKRHFNVELNIRLSRRPPASSSTLQEVSKQENVDAPVHMEVSSTTFQEHISTSKHTYEEPSVPSSKDIHDYIPLDKMEDDNMIESRYEKPMKTDGDSHPYVPLKEHGIVPTQVSVTCTIDGCENKNNKEKAERDYEDICEENMDPN